MTVSILDNDHSDPNLKAELTDLDVQDYSHFEILIDNWEDKARRAFYDAESETNVMGKRLIEHGAMCLFNCALSLKEALKHHGQTTSLLHSEDQT